MADSVLDIWVLNTFEKKYISWPEVVQGLVRRKPSHKQTMKLVKVCVRGLRAGKLCTGACRPLLLLPHCPVLPFHYLCFPILYVHLC